MPRSSLAAFLVGSACGPVAPLVVGDRGPLVLATSGPPLPLLPLQAQQVQRTADLLHRHLRIFPPATAPCGRRQRSALAGTASGASSARRSSCPHSARSPAHSCPPGRRVPRSNGGRPPAPKSLAWRWPAHW